MRTFLLPIPFLLVLLLQTGSSLAVDNDFSSYPQGSQQCLYDSADQAGCKSADTGADLNQCLCKNRNNFVYNTASCVGKKSPSDTDAVYETLVSNCAGTGVTLSVSKEAFLAAAAAATQTTSIPSQTSSTASTTSSASSVSSTTSSSQSPTPTNSGQPSMNNGLSTGTKIGIGVGVGFGVIAAVLAAWFIWAYQKRRRSAHSDRSNDTLGGGSGSSYGGVGAFGIANGPHHEYANDNTQQGAAELAPVAWKPAAGYEAPAYTAVESKNGAKADVPLLAELGNESEAQQRPVELPGTEGYLGYSDRLPEHSPNPGHEHGAVTPEGLSPAAYSQTGTSDVSHFTYSRYSGSGTYR
ncbi:hypothetical protein HD806DRAFT_22733 [Xylariaceae sp. AK1471]|nr:hypothetical protein HD806DRAFT_22733 [Xylariaceae sp. AK1471]